MYVDGFVVPVLRDRAEDYVKLEPGEVVFFSWITFRDRAHRDEVNAKVMADPRLDWDKSVPQPMNMQRMIWGGFVPRVRLGTGDI